LTGTHQVDRDPLSFPDIASMVFCRDHKLVAHLNFK